MCGGGVGGLGYLKKQTNALNRHVSVQLVAGTTALLRGIWATALVRAEAEWDPSQSDSLVQDLGLVERIGWRGGAHAVAH